MDKTTPLECAGGITKVAEFADKMGIPMLCGIAEVRIAEDVRAMLSCDIPLWILKEKLCFLGNLSASLYKVVRLGAV